MNDVVMVREWFANHRAEFSEYKSVDHPDGQHIKRLKWRRPGTAAYAVDYYIHGGTLFVCGDLGDGVFHFSGEANTGLTWEFLADCQLDYFLKKCQASESGLPYRDWDAEHVQKRMDSEVECRCASEELSPAAAEWWHENKPKCMARDAWSAWIVDNSDELIGFFGEGIFEDGWIYRIGEVPPIRAIAWLVGIQMALAQLSSSH